MRFSDRLPLLDIDYEHRHRSAPRRSREGRPQYVERRTWPDKVAEAGDCRHALNMDGVPDPCGAGIAVYLHHKDAEKMFRRSAGGNILIQQVLATVWSLHQPHGPSVCPDPLPPSELQSAAAVVPPGLVFVHSQGFGGLVRETRASSPDPATVARASPPYRAAGPALCRPVRGIRSSGIHRPDRCLKSR